MKRACKRFDTQENHYKPKFELRFISNSGYKRVPLNTFKNLK